MPAVGLEAFREGNGGKGKEPRQKAAWAATRQPHARSALGGESPGKGR